MGNSDSFGLDGSLPYHYIPSLAAGIIFLTLFSVSTLLHTGQLVYYRMWWFLPTAVFCGLLEILGWSSRVWSSISPTLFLPYTIQTTVSVLAPTPLVAANFIILGRIIRQLGPEYSRLNPRRYTIIFTSADVIALVIQGGGGGLAATAARSGKSPNLGGDIILGGVIFQLIMIAIYAICACEFYWRYFKRRPMGRSGYQQQRAPPANRLNNKMKLLSVSLACSTLCLLIRSVYRTIEFADGWSGKIVRTQALFYIFDGTMVALAMWILNIAHPGRLLGKNLAGPEFSDASGKTTSPNPESDRGILLHSYPPV